MFPYFSIFGHTIPAYSLLSLTGVLLALLYYSARGVTPHFRKRTASLSSSTASPALFSARNSCFSPQCCRNFSEIPFSVFRDGDLPRNISVQRFRILRRILRHAPGCMDLLPACPSGFRRMSPASLSDDTAVSRFRRIGCFFMGCCYGKESSLLGIEFENSLSRQTTCR